MSTPTKKRNPIKQSAKISAKKIDLSERRALVMELRKQGGSYRAIAEQLRENFAQSGEHGVTARYDHTVAYDDFKAALEELKSRSVDAMEENRAMDLERLDALLAGHFDAAQKGDPIATDKVMAIIKERAAWFGYNAPTKLDHLSSDGSMRPTGYQFVPYVKPDTDSA